MQLITSHDKEDLEGRTNDTGSLSAVADLVFPLPLPMAAGVFRQPQLEPSWRAAAADIGTGRYSTAPGAHGDRGKGTDWRDFTAQDTSGLLK